jgi:hypothetical protein
MKKKSETSQPKWDLRIQIVVKPLQSDFNKRAADCAKRADRAFKKKKTIKIPD